VQIGKGVYQTGSGCGRVGLARAAETALLTEVKMISKQYMIVLISAIAAMGVVAAFVCRHREPELPVLLPADWRAYVDASGEPLDRDAVLLYYRALMDRAEEHRIAGRLVDAEIYVQVSRQISLD